MLTRDLLLALREGWPVPPEAVQAFGANLGAGEISDAQAGAFAMAICLQGLSEEGRVALTLGMRDSAKGNIGARVYLQYKSRFGKVIDQLRVLNRMDPMANPLNA